MRIYNLLVRSVPVLVAQFCMIAAYSGEPVDSGFFDDYSQLEPTEAAGLDYIYARPALRLLNGKFSNSSSKPSRQYKRQKVQARVRV